MFLKTAHSKDHLSNFIKTSFKNFRQLILQPAVASVRWMIFTSWKRSAAKGSLSGKRFMRERSGFPSYKVFRWTSCSAQSAQRCNKRRTEQTRKEKNQC